ncbi:MAG: polysaccharide biosynthesis protein, partial [Bacillota bacterium]|nr:polysaccharide biosynthesis protein [Bacillota bacterium]
MEKLNRIVSLMVIDAGLVALAGFVALVIRFETISKIPLQYFEAFSSYIVVFVVVRVACFYLFGLYNRLWRYA